MSHEEEQKSESIKIVDKRRFNEDGQKKSDAPDDREDKVESKSSSSRPKAEVKSEAKAEPQISSSHPKQDIPTDEDIKNDFSEMMGEAPPLDFSTFVMGLAHQALILLGQVEDPYTKQKNQNIEGARQTIDTIALLEEKTKGNLTPDEAKLLQESLAVLRMSYVKEKKLN